MDDVEFLKWIHGKDIPENITKEVFESGVTVYSVGGLDKEKYIKKALELLLSAE